MEAAVRRLRRYARNHDEKLRHVARDVVNSQGVAATVERRVA